MLSIATDVAISVTFIDTRCANKYPPGVEEFISVMFDPWFGFVVGLVRKVPGFMVRDVDTDLLGPGHVHRLVMREVRVVKVDDKAQYTIEANFVEFSTLRLILIFRAGANNEIVDGSAHCRLTR